VAIDAYASMAHYARHLLPIWHALAPEVRGTFWAADRDGTWGVPITAQHPGPSQLMMVASHLDAMQMAPRPLVYVEHGAGQTYDGDPSDERAATSPSYAGGADHERVVLFLCPSERVAAAWSARYPASQVATVGSPVLDRWTGPDRQSLAPRATWEAPVVAVTFHWECVLCPETTSAWRYYDSALPALAREESFTLLGHGHPRLWPTIARRWESLGVASTPDPDRVMAEADVLVADNTSLLYEFAATGRPVVVLNAPWYRRTVHHGLRFWDAVPGEMVDGPDDLAGAIHRALSSPGWYATERSRAVAVAYDDLMDGCAAQRSATAITEVLHARSSRG